MAKSIDDVLAQMRGNGIDVPLSVDINKAFDGYLRWRPTAENKPKKSAWARLFSWRSPTSQIEYITGAYGWRGNQYTVEASNADWSPAERAAELEARKAAMKAAEEDRAKDAQAAALKAEQMWARGKPAEDTAQHPYLAAKKVSAFDLRVAFKRLLVPLRDLAGKLHGLQYIDPDGAKIFGTGTVKEGHFHLIGQVASDQPIGFGEGYATCAAGHMGTGWPVVTCFDAGNLEPVMAAWRKLYPDHKFFILADDDRHLLQRLCERLLKLGIVVAPHELKAPIDMSWQVPDGPSVECKAGWKPDTNGGPMRLEGSLTVDGQAQIIKIENAGMAKAASAAKRHKAQVLAPVFSDKSHKGTDWNDLLCDIGLEATRKALLHAFEAPPPEKKRANGTPQAGTEEANAKITQPDGGMSFAERFTLIYGTTTVWDEKQREIIRLEALKVAYGKLVDYWLGSDKRNMVSQSNVVFDPTGKVSLPEYVNLFDRLPLDPDPKGKCDLIVKHFYNLCNEDDNLFHWLMCWLAFPLQHPGAKMRTSVILHGRTEGTGKSLGMDIMRDIYGSFSRTITQRQLESEFNGWQSGMLFCVAEEVLSRQDRAHLQGLIQNMITNKVVPINEKNMPLRQEANYTNFVFLSNNQVPMLLNDTDRRFTVIRVEQQHPQKYFEALGEEIDNGGSAALYSYLLKYDTQGFTEHTRPFENRDRDFLITLGMSPDRRFFEYWSRGQAGVPFGTCTARDLYIVFKAWCRCNGERFVANSTAFGRTVTECLDRYGTPPKKQMRWEGYSEKQIETGIGGSDTPTSQQSVVYIIPRSVREKVGLEKADQNAEQEDALDPKVASQHIQAFQQKMCDIILSARRAF